MIAKKRLNDLRLVGFVAPLHLAGETRGGGVAPSSTISGAKVSIGRALEVAGHQKAAGRQRRQREAVVARGAEILGEQRGRAWRVVFLGAPSDRPKRLAPRHPRRAGRAPTAAPAPERLRRPLRVGSSRAAGDRAATRRDNRRCRWSSGGGAGREPAFRRSGSLAVREMRRVDCGQWRPGAAGQRGEMLLIGEARHAIVGLRIEMRALQPALGKRRETAAARFAPGPAASARLVAAPAR